MFFDFKAAFDSVDHEILFKKLEERNINVKIIDMIKLIYSSCFTKINNKGKPIPIN